MLTTIEEKKEEEKKMQSSTEKRKNLAKLIPYRESENYVNDFVLTK